MSLRDPAPTSLSALLEQSRKFTSQISRPDQTLPSIQLGLDQIEVQSRRLATKSAQRDVGNNDMELDDNLSRASYMLAQANVDTSQLSKTLNALQPASAFMPLQPHRDNDMHFIIKQAQESALIAGIEESRRRTLQDFRENMRLQMLRDWEKSKVDLFDELARHHPSLVAGDGDDPFGSTGSTSRSGRPRRSSTNRRTSAGQAMPSYDTYMQPSATNIQPGSELQMHNKMMKYDQAVARICQARVDNVPFGVVSVLADASSQATASGTGLESRSFNAAESWTLLKSIVGEHDVQADGQFGRQVLQEAQFAEAHWMTGSEADAPAAIELRKRIAFGARTYLEEQFMKHVEATLAKNPQQANLGGVPSVTNKIRAYVSMVYGQNQTLEQINQQPVWARIFFLARAGHLDEALAYATSNENLNAINSAEPNFVTYLKSYCLPANSRRLPKAVKERFLTEYNQRIRYLSSAPGANNAADPFKLALYKLIGRAELTKRNIPGATDKTEHWLWLQLALTSEELDVQPNERYTLRDFANVLRKFGESYWDPKGSKPGLYFNILLMSGQFERAVAFLYNRQSYRTDAVHFGIALAYYGLLKFPEQAYMSELDLPGYEVVYVNRARLLHRYYWSFAKADPTHALQYICCISLSLSKARPAQQQEQRAVIADYTKELVVESRAIGGLLGELDAEGQKTSGAVQRNLKLLAAADNPTFVQSLVRSVVTSSDIAAHFNEAILLYNIAEDYNSVIDVICKELGSSLSANTPANNENQQDVLSISQSVLSHYDNNDIRLERQRRDTLQKLIKLKEAFKLNEAGKLDEALIAIESLPILPLNAAGDVVPIIKASEDFKELDESITRNFDAILITTMNILYGLHTQLKESPYGDSSRQTEMADIKRKARTLMMFAGMLRYRLTAETYSELARRDVFIH